MSGATPGTFHAVFVPLAARTTTCRRTHPKTTIGTRQPWTTTTGKTLAASSVSASASPLRFSHRAPHPTPGVPRASAWLSSASALVCFTSLCSSLRSNPRLRCVPSTLRCCAAVPSSEVALPVIVPIGNARERGSNSPTHVQPVPPCPRACARLRACASSVEEARGQAPDHLATHEVSTKIASLLCCLAVSLSPSLPLAPGLSAALPVRRANIPCYGSASACQNRGSPTTPAQQPWVLESAPPRVRSLARSHGLVSMPAACPQHNLPTSGCPQGMPRPATTRIAGRGGGGGGGLSALRQRTCAQQMSIVELGTAGDLMHKYEKTHQKVVLAIVLGVISTVACLVRLALFRVDKLVGTFHLRVHTTVCACVRACACVCVCVLACARARARVRVSLCLCLCLPVPVVSSWWSWLGDRAPALDTQRSRTFVRGASDRRGATATAHDVPTNNPCACVPNAA